MKAINLFLTFLVLTLCSVSSVCAQTRYVGQVIWGGWNFCPAGFLRADGSLYPISENEVLFQLIGTTYGGDGQATFAVPNMQGRVILHSGQGVGLSNHVLGEAAGAESLTLSTSQMAAHSHELAASADPATTKSPGNNVLASGVGYRGNSSNTAALNVNTIQPSGASQPVQKMPPFLGLTACISAFGIFPPQN